MALEVIEITPKHRELLNRLGELIPDLDPNSPASLQRVFGLGLIVEEVGRAGFLGAGHFFGW